jgi:hypothetical protein
VLLQVLLLHGMGGAEDKARAIAHLLQMVGAWTWEGAQAKHAERDNGRRGRSSSKGRSQQKESPCVKMSRILVDELRDSHGIDLSEWGGGGGGGEAEGALLGLRNAALACLGGGYAALRMRLSDAMPHHWGEGGGEGEGESVGEQSERDGVLARRLLLRGAACGDAPCEVLRLTQCTCLFILHAHAEHSH